MMRTDKAFLYWVTEILPKDEELVISLQLDESGGMISATKNDVTILEAEIELTDLYVFRCQLNLLFDYLEMNNNWPNLSPQVSPEENEPL